MTRRGREFPRLRGAGAAGIAAVLLGACSAVQPPRYHTLMPAATASAPKLASAGSLAWEVLPVAIPMQVDQPQWVVRTIDGSLAVLEQERWIAPLGEEIRAAVAERLTRSLGSPAASAEPGRQWRVQIDVRRFDSTPGREARLEAAWTLRSGADSAVVLSCRGDFVQPVAAGGYLPLAKGHQDGVAKLGDAIGTALKALSAGRPAACDT
jgi:uncharacterized lipoprotein YmbA